ncbi:hypothetical protein DW228_06475 [Bacteroides fragilis]|uniref:Uncharacterized protein n=1 Tax=Bacteroides fragilis TaxID=817 RepID=A0A396C5S9_BACFG|nr:hypothetical protein [Bacteroides fragilis]RHH14443.1 hypothetical protein DW228_06475 [Bacteroides fragilis]
MTAKQTYKELVSLQEELAAMQKNFIIETVKSHGGIITFTPEQEDEDNNDTDQELYPMTAIFYDGDQSYPNVSITAVHIFERPEIEDTEIYVDGINQNTYEHQENFNVSSEDYTNVVTFIGTTLGFNNQQQK